MRESGQAEDKTDATVAKLMQLLYRYVGGERSATDGTRTFTTT